MRPDRNQFVSIIGENILPGEEEKNFALKPSSTYTTWNTPFDASSVMMYGPHDFAVNDTETGRPKISIQPLQGGVDIRQGKGINAVPLLSII